MSYFFGALAVVAFFVGLLGAVNTQVIIAVLGFGVCGVFVGCVLVVEWLKASLDFWGGSNG